jgi:hypothetical protein
MWYEVCVCARTVQLSSCRSIAFAEIRRSCRSVHRTASATAPFWAVTRVPGARCLHAHSLGPWRFRREGGTHSDEVDESEARDEEAARSAT